MKILLILILCFPLYASPPKKQHSIHKKKKYYYSLCTNKKNAICEAIITLKKNISPQEAYTLSNHIVKISRKYKLPPILMTVIGYQESTLKLETIRSVKGFIQDETGIYQESTVETDFCMMQINVFNIKKMGLDVNRLVTDVEYCLEAGARILVESKRFKNKEGQFWWTRYNAVSEIHKKNYQEAILKHWRKVDPHIDQKNKRCPLIIQ